MDRHNAKNASGAGGKNAVAPLTFTIPSDFTAGRDVQRQVMAAVARNGFDDDNTFAVRIALEEAIVNAMKHGHRGDLAKTVRFRYYVSPRELRAEVEDEGPGFDPARLPDPLAPENLLKASGRGIFLIRSFMDELVLRRAPEGGMEVVMVKRGSRPECRLQNAE